MTTRDILFDKADSLIRTRGVTDFSFADLATAVGIRKPSVHHHFATKADLTMATLERYEVQFWIDLQSGSNDLHGLVDLYRASLGEGDHWCLCLALTANLASVDDKIQQKINSFNRDLIAWLDIRGHSGVQVLATLQGAQVLARAAGDPAMFEAAVAHLAGET